MQSDKNVAQSMMQKASRSCMATADTDTRKKHEKEYDEGRGMDKHVGLVIFSHV